MKKTITILVPAYNEAQVLGAMIKRLDEIADGIKKYHFEFLFVNDGSKDETLSLLHQESQKNKRISYINLSRNYGKDIAMIAGFDHAKGDAVVIMDADLQDPPELIPQMIQYWEEGYDDVYARRRSRKGETFFKKKTSELYYAMLQKTTRIPLQRDTGDFRLLSKRCVEAMREFRESQRYTKGLFSWLGFNKKEILYDRDPRLAGATKYNYIAMIEHALDGLTLFTVTPLRIATIFGFLVSIAAFAYTIVIIIQACLGSTVPGYASIMSVVLFLGGAQLISLGVVGEYVGRIFNETKKRPLYFVEKYHQAIDSPKE